MTARYLFSYKNECVVMRPHYLWGLFPVLKRERERETVLSKTFIFFFSVFFFYFYWPKKKLMTFTHLSHCESSFRDQIFIHPRISSHLMTALESFWGLSRISMFSHLTATSLPKEHFFFLFF